MSLNVGRGREGERRGRGGREGERERGTGRERMREGGTGRDGEGEMERERKRVIELFFNASYICFSLMFLKALSKGTCEQPCPPFIIECVAC